MKDIKISPETPKNRYFFSTFANKTRIFRQEQLFRKKNANLVAFYGKFTKLDQFGERKYLYRATLLIMHKIHVKKPEYRINDFPSLYDIWA